VRRVSVVGNSGSGKSTLAVALAARLGVPCVELDAIFHQPGWTELPPEEFRARAAAAAAGDAWVVDGNYSAVRDLVWARADTVVWLDLPRAVVMRRVVSRTVVRVVRRQELWNGNREPWSNFLALDPQRSIIGWAWTQHAKYRDRYEAAMADPAWAHLRFVRLRSAADMRRFLAQPLLAG
jgi:adenylate kinase family enzyme